MDRPRWKCVVEENSYAYIMHPLNVDYEVLEI